MSLVQQPAIVIVDDNEKDIALFKRLLEEAKVTNQILPFRNGTEAIRYFGRVAVGECPRPLVCFADIKMPGDCSGFDVLGAIRSADELDGVSVIMFSFSDDRRDIVKAAETGAQCYLVKHPSAATLRALIEDAKEFSKKKDTTKAALFKVEANLLPR